MNDGTISPGVTRSGKPVTIRFGDRSIVTIAGQSVLAALVEAGEKAFRTTARGEQRGMFCGMGVCQECLVDIDGQGNQRACMTTVHEGLTVNYLTARPEPVAANAAPEWTDIAADVLVIGGGPAGLSAASVAAEAGLDVVLVDERSKLGGQFYKQPADGFSIDESRIDGQFVRGRALIARAKKAGVRILQGMTVWATFGAEEIVAGNATEAVVIHPKRLVLATGAYERGVPLPGWTLPGFMTTGAAQTLLRSYQIPPGKRVIIAGNGPLNLQVAAELVRAGVKVVALVEAARAPGLASVTSVATMAMAAPDLVRDGVAYQWELRRAGTPTFHQHVVVRAEGAVSVERAVIARIDGYGLPVAGTERSFDVDAVCVGFGFLPSNEIARTLGCRHRFDERRGHLVADRDESGRSSVANVWIVGDSAGLGGARVAQAGGILAGVDTAASMGKPLPASAEAKTAMRTKVRSERFQEALWRLFSAPRLVDQLAHPDTIVCRCEEVSLAAIEAGLDDEIATAGALKRTTRAGMGRCQGRYCGSIAVELVARRRNSAVDEFSYFAPRVPFRPLPVSAIASEDESRLRQT